MDSPDSSFPGSQELEPGVHTTVDEGGCYDPELQGVLQPDVHTTMEPIGIEDERFTIQELLQILVSDYERKRTQHPVPGLQTRASLRGFRQLSEDLHARRIPLFVTGEEGTAGKGEDAIG